MNYATADLTDRDGTLACCEVQFRSFGKHKRFYGVIRTIRCFEDNLLIKETFGEQCNGCVLVVDGGGSLRSALVGDVIAGLGERNGWVGAIIWGAIRDSVAIDAMEFGIKAIGTNPRKSAKIGHGEIDVPVSFGNTTFRPGEHVYSDEDGIVISKEAV